MESSDDLGRFLRERPRLLSIAYRIVGSAAEAEDIVQDAYIRWQKKPRVDVAAANAFLARTVTRLALDRLRLARHAREEYVGPWLPEPVSDDWPGIDGDLESLSLAFMVLLETLSPLERAAFILHEGPGYDYKALATMLNRTEAACRQLVKRAKEHVRSGRIRFTASRSAHQELLQAFINACRAGDMETLNNMLTQDVALVSDGGGRTPAAQVPLVGREMVARFLLSQAQKKLDLIAEVALINGRPTVVTRRPDGNVEDVLELVSIDGQISAIYAIRNPDKLRFVAHRWKVNYQRRTSRL